MPVFSPMHSLHHGAPLDFIGTPSWVSVSVWVGVILLPLWWWIGFNVADGLYKNGKFEEAATLFRSLGEDAASPLAGPSRFNLGNALFQKQDYRGAVQAYRDALRLAPDDLDARRNLELALRALKEQEEQKQNLDEDEDDREERRTWRIKHAWTSEPMGLRMA